MLLSLVVPNRFLDMALMHQQSDAVDDATRMNRERLARMK